MAVEFRCEFCLADVGTARHLVVTDPLHQIARCKDKSECAVRTAVEVVRIVADGPEVWR